MQYFPTMHWSMYQQQISSCYVIFIIVCFNVFSCFCSLKMWKGGGNITNGSNKSYVTQPHTRSNIVFTPTLSSTVCVSCCSTPGVRWVWLPWRRCCSSCCSSTTCWYPEFGLLIPPQPAACGPSLSPAPTPASEWTTAAAASAAASVSQCSGVWNTSENSLENLPIFSEITYETKICPLLIVLYLLESLHSVMP